MTKLHSHHPLNLRKSDYVDELIPAQHLKLVFFQLMPYRQLLQSDMPLDCIRKVTEAIQKEKKQSIIIKLH